MNSISKLIGDVGRGEGAIGAGAVTITADRERAVDFSEPFFDSGLQILVPGRNRGFLVLIGVVLVAAHVIWLIERRSNPESYRSGIWGSLWWAAVTANTVGYGDKTP